MGLLGQMTVRFGGDTTHLVGAVKAAKSIIATMADNPLKGVALGLGALAVAAIGVGVASVKSAGDFQQAMLSLVAHAGLAKSQFDRVSQAVLAMSSEVGRSPTQLAEALYPILSAFSGIQNQAAKSTLALTTLKLSFEAVAGTTVNGTDVANAAVGTFNALGLATNNAAVNAQRMKALFDTMDLTVQLGNMQWAQYKNVISKLAVSIQGTTINFNEASAALATMTNEGFSAQKAQTYLSNTFTALAIKTDALAKHAKKLGISFDEAKYGPMTLAEKIQYLNEITGGNKQELLALMGNNATALKTFNALSTGLKSYESNLKSLQHAHGALAASFATASQGFNFHMQQLKAAGQALMVALGTGLLPIVTGLVARVTPLIVSFTQWETKTHGVERAIGAIGDALNKTGQFIGRVVSVGAGIVSFFQHSQVAALALLIPLGMLSAVLVQMAVTSIVAFIASIPALVAGFITWAGAAAAAAIATIAATWPILAIGAAIGILIAIIILLVTHWGAVTKFLQTTWQGFTHWFMGALKDVGNFFTNIWNSVVTFIKGVWTAIVDFVKTHVLLLAAVIFGPIGAIVVFIITHWTQIKNFLTNLWANIVKTAESWGSNIINAILNGLKAAWSGIANFFTGALNWIKSLFPHSPVEEGPLKGIETWGGNITDVLANGLLGGVSRVQSAALAVAGAIAGPLSGPSIIPALADTSQLAAIPGRLAGLSGGRFGSHGTHHHHGGTHHSHGTHHHHHHGGTHHHHGTHTHHHHGGGSGGFGNETLTIIVELEGMKLVEWTGKASAKHVRLKAGRRR